MKKFLIAGSSLAAVASAGAAGAVDITLGGSIDMGVEFGVGKNANGMAISDSYNNISLSLGAAGTTDGGLMYGASFSFATSAELSLDAYTDDGAKNLVKMTVAGATDLEAAAYNVSGGAAINAAEIVGVKINSDWMSVGDTQTDFALPVGPMDATNICKLAGRIATSNYDIITTRTGLYGVGAELDVDEAGRDIEIPANDGYLAAQELTFWTITTEANTPVAGIGITAGVDVRQVGIGDDAVFRFDGRNNIPGMMDGEDAQSILDADKVYMGPLMEVKLQSSSTKMVIGAVCVEGVKGSETNYFMNVASKVLTASDATVYIEGGFGKLTVQTGDYAGGVSAIGDAGDVADLEVNGLGIIMTGVGMLGANPYVAVDLAPTTDPANAMSLSNLEILTGGTIDLGGLSAAVDVLVSSDDITTIDAWDLGLDYSMGDMALSFAYDNTNAWGMSASMDVAGFGVDATIYNKAAGDHEKNGLFYSLAASTSLNGFGLSMGVDQDLKPTLGLTKSMGGLSIYAGYDAADAGGKVGATLSF